MSDSTLHTRRQFLRTGVLGGAMAWTLPVFLEKTFFVLDAAAADSAVQVATGKDSPILVVLQMAGGNDGLNTIIPYADDAYYAARPHIGIHQDKVLKVTDLVGFNPNLAGLRGLYDSGELGVIQGVGYPNPNRSHFRSTDIWQTASDSNKFEREGWLGRYFDSCCKGADPAVGVAVGRQTPQAFTSQIPTGITLSNPQQFRFIADGAATEEAFRDMNSPEDDAPNAGGSVAMLSGSAPGGDTLDFLRRTALDAQVSSDRVLEITRKVKQATTFPKTQLGNSLGLVAKLIAGGMPTRVYYVSQGGFDTHNNQLSSHEKLMQDLDGSLKAFVADLKAQGNFNRVFVMTFSEFGRRVAENNSGGTDHGAAAPMFILGGGIKPGLYGQQPDLKDLHDGDLKYNVDFRNIYATVLDKWLKAPSEAVLKQKFQNMAFV